MNSAASKRKFKIYQDEVKLRHTSHWDADFMSRADFEAYMRGELPARSSDNDAHPATVPVAGEEDRRRAAPTLWQRFVRAYLTPR